MFRNRFENFCDWTGKLLAEKNSAHRKSAPVPAVKSTQRAALELKPDAAVGKQQDVPVETRDLDLEMEGQPECDDTREGVACADGARQTTQDDHETDHETVEEIEPDAQSGPEVPEPRAGSASVGWSQASLQGKQVVQPPADRQSVPKWMPTLRHLQTADGKRPPLRQRRGDLQ
ncbi:hypothetical protein AK812_SmicGene10528 [Symbiodinium microadriaticum]|uniref:Uncharacterized protein n=1 Tax=Symbiodinium microadriaticum TaxID=2951 RepID=A0A1Q9EFM6_SYMMI|nr:hypothetical protein AK812_SmicGene10528 [Symbiodinium microadriaticum]